MEEKQLTHEESLRIIQGMIDTAKNKLSENGFHFLLWGTLVILASLAQYFMALNGMGNASNLVWIIMPFVGMPAAFIYEYKRGKTERTQSHTEKFYQLLWIGFGVTLGLSIFISVSGKMSPIPVILALVGLATFVSGNISAFRPLIVGSLIFWAASIVAVFISPMEQLLLNAGATFLGYIVPGILLWRKANKTANV